MEKGQGEGKEQLLAACASMAGILERLSFT